MAGLATSSSSPSSTLGSPSPYLFPLFLPQCVRYGPLGEASVGANGTGAIDKLT